LDTLNLLAIALELAEEEARYEDMASKFGEHFICIAHAMSNHGHNRKGLWNQNDGFFMMYCKVSDGTQFPMKIRSMVGLVPLFAVETMESEVLDRYPTSSGVSSGSSTTVQISRKLSPACAARAQANADCCRLDIRISLGAFS
jgi:hypothetical protein